MNQTLDRSNTTRSRILGARRVVAGLLGLALLGVAACSERSSPVLQLEARGHLLVRPAAATIADDGTLMLTADLRDLSGRPMASLPEGAELRWSTYNSAVAQVQPTDGLTGRVTGLQAGRTVIQVSLGSLTATAEVEVEATPRRIEKRGPDVALGMPGELTSHPARVQVLDRHGSPVAGVPVRFDVTSGGGALANPVQRSDEFGFAESAWILGPEAGLQTVTASAGELPPTEVFAFANGDTATATLVALTPQVSRGTAGSTLGAPLEIRARDAAGRPLLGVPVEWSASAGVILPASPVTDIQGRASARWMLGPSAGIQTASARLLTSPETGAAGGAFPSPASVLFEVQVDARPPASISALPADVILPLGNAARVGVALFDDQGNRLTQLPELGLHVGDATVAAGTRDGLLPEFVFSGLRPGTTQAVFTAGGLADTIRIHVQGATGGSDGDPPPVGTLALSPSTLELEPGRSAGLVITARSAGGVDLPTSEVVWASSAPAIAVVDAFGRVTALAAGTATITATLDGLVASTTVTVSESAEPPEGPRPPGRVTDLGVVGRTTTAITVAFRAVDDGSPGPVLHEIRHARAPLGFGWGQADVLDSGVCASPLSMTPGREIECTIGGLEPGTAYDFQLVAWRVASDGQRVYSPLSNIASGTTVSSGGGGDGGGGTGTNTPRTVLVSPSTTTLDVGDSRGLSVTVLDGSGTAMSGVPVVWTSTNPSVVTVDGSGTIVGVGPGTASIHATAGGVVGTSSVSVLQNAPPPGGGGGGGIGTGTYPNQPTGMTRLAQFDGTQVHTSDPGWGYYYEWDRRVSVVDDPDNPLGTGKALHFAWDTGVAALGLADINTWGRNYRELYIMYRIKYDPNWEKLGHKNFYFGTPLQNRGGKGANQYFVTHEASGNANFVQQWANPTDLAFSAAGAWAGKYGRYVNVEIHAIAESSPGAGDGAVYYWHDGVLLGSNTNFAWTDSSDVVAGFDGFHWYAVRNQANSRDSWFRVGELYISGR